MPKLTRAPSHHQYSHSQPQIPVALAPQQAQIAPAAMSYYQTARPVSGYYGDLSATGPSGPMTMASYEAYGVPASLHQLPTAAASASAATMGGPVGGPPPLPAQHRASSGAWNPDDDQALLQLRAMGKNWNQIQREAFPSKTGNACRKRHERLMERRGQNDFDNRKLERLSKEYMSMRKEIWQPLAARCGEKWNVVEAQCMSNGLKNIQSHARAFARRERLETGGHHHIPGVVGGTGYDDDSGVSGIGGAMTPIDEDLNPQHESYGHSPDPSGSGGGGGGSSSVQSTPPGSNGSSAASQHAYHAPIHGGGHGHGHYSQAAYQQVVGGGYHHQQQHHNHHHHHGYSNSMSSTGSTAGYGNSNNNQGAQSPYMGHNNRLPSVGDMGIDAIINRGSGGNNQQL